MDKNDSKHNKMSEEDYKALIKDLEKEVKIKQGKIDDLNLKLRDSNSRVRDMIEKNKSLEFRVNEYELQNITMKFGKFEELKEKTNKLDHRTKVTKKHLDDARDYLKFTEVVILDLEKRGIIDLILRRKPCSYIAYKNEFSEDLE